MGTQGGKNPVYNDMFMMDIYSMILLGLFTLHNVYRLMWTQTLRRQERHKYLYNGDVIYDILDVFIYDADVRY